MKYKKRSLKKKQRQRYRFSKKYAAAVTVQRGGGFMDVISELNAMEGRTNTCMAVHPTQPLVAVGDDAGIVTLWEINQSQPKKLAQLTGLPTAVKFVEFHKTFPVVAAACSDRVLMWKFDKISREQQQQQEGAVQQLEPSHTLSVFGLRSQEEVEQELRKMEQMKKEAKEENENVNGKYLSLRKTLSDITSKIYDIEEAMKPLQRGLSVVTNDDEVLKTKREELQELTQQLKELEEQQILIDDELANIKKLDINTYRDFIEKHKKTIELESELEMIRIDARDEVSCIAFYPLWSEKNSSYIAVGVNNHKNIDDNRNRIIMHRFNIEHSSSSVIYTLPPSLVGEPPNEIPDDVLTASFSHDGRLFAFVTKSSDGTTVLKVQNFKDGEYRYYQSECKSYRIDGEKKRAITSIRPYSSDTLHHYHGTGTQRKNEFLIGCDDGSLTMIQAITETPRSITKVTELTSIPGQEWTSGEAIECVAVHPSSLPLFASGSRNSVQVWGIDSRDALESLSLQPGLVPVRSIGFNQNFLAVCGPGNVHIYSCNAEDYRGLKEELHKELLAGRQGECSICGDPMNDPLSQQALRSGPADAQEVYLECGHKFHKDCIELWIKQGKTCPICRGKGGIAKATPQRIVEGREGRDKQKLEESKKSIAYEPRVLFGQPAAASSASSASETVSVADIERRQKEQSENRGGSKQNKYSSRKKYCSKKSKNRHRYSKKYKY